MRAALTEGVTSLDSSHHITVGYDGSPLSELCIVRALRRASSAPLGSVRVVCVAEERGGQMLLPSGQLLSRWAALDSLRHIVSLLHLDTADLGITGGVYAHLRTGNPAQVIVDLAYRYHSDLIVVGANGQSASSPIGRVATEILSLSEIPVELQTPLQAAPPTRPFNPLRFAYVFGGSGLRDRPPRGRGVSST